MLFVFVSILLIKNRKFFHDCYKEHLNFDEYPFDSFDYSISCKNNKTQYINLIYPNQESKLSIYQTSNISITCSKFNQQLNTINLSIYNTPNITFQNDCHFNNMEINGSPKFNFLPQSHVFGQNLILNNISNDFIQEYISSKTEYNKTNNKSIKSETSLLEINQWTVDCNADMQIILSKVPSIICGNRYEIDFEYDFFTNTSFNLHDNYVNFQKTDFKADSYMKSIISSIHYDDETNVIFTDYYVHELDDIINLYDKNKLNIAITMVFRDDPYKYSMKEILYAQPIRWRRIHVNTKFYYYGYNYNDDEIIEISSKTKTTITWVAILVVIFLMLSYCFVAQWRFYAKA